MAVVLDWSNEQEKFEVPDSWVTMFEKLLHEAAQHEGLSAVEVTLTLVDNAQIHDINKQYRNIDRPTDVISFALNDDVEDEMEIIFEVEDESELDPISGMLGDIIISIERAEEQRQEYGHSLERELGFLFVHGFLHLLGYDHDNDEAEKEMFGKQELILQKVGLTR